VAAKKQIRLYPQEINVKIKDPGVIELPVKQSLKIPIRVILKTISELKIRYFDKV
jgi:hypothetical protein